MKFLKNILYKLISLNNNKVQKKWDDYRFLVNLCTENRTLDLDKFNRLLKMVKRKYRR